jgi:hypothetical protein
MARLGTFKGRENRDHEQCHLELEIQEKEANAQKEGRS